MTCVNGINIHAYFLGPLSFYVWHSMSMAVAKAPKMEWRHVYSVLSGFDRQDVYVNKGTTPAPVFN